MANRPTGYGLTAQTKKKIDAKYNEDMATEVVNWINQLTFEDDEIDEPMNSVSREYVQQKLKDGIILCKIMNMLSPGAISKIHPAKANSFKLMENISNFLKAAEDYGCDRGDLFQSVNLTEGQNMQAVIQGIQALGRKAQTNGFDGPTLGPKEAEANPREFTDEQLRQGRVQGY